MNWDGAGFFLAVVVALVGSSNYIIGLRVENMLSKNMDTLRSWINGSFMRAPEVQARMNSIETRLELLEVSHGNEHVERRK